MPDSPASANPTVAVTRRKQGRPRDSQAGAAIIAATLDLVAAHGVAGLSVDAVAAAAGCSKATIYRRWASKEELVADALRSGTPRIEPVDTGSFRGDVERYINELIDRLSKGRIDVIPHLAHTRASNAAVRAALDEYHVNRERPMREILLRGIERGEVSPDVDFDIIIEILLGPVIYRCVFSDRSLDASFAGRLLDVLVHSIQT